MGAPTQAEHYRRTGARYDELHTARDDEHYLALGHIAAYLRWIGARTALDTGCGTGRAIRFLGRALPDVHVRGNDPSQELLSIAVERHGVPPGDLDCASSEQLPYPDGSFDAVIETGMLHHVPKPELVVAEMLRVARLAVFISDDNTYAHGPLTRRLAKLALSRARLLGVVNRGRRGLQAWHYSESDGIAWNYSVFDSLAAIRRACASVVVVSTSPERTPLIPLLQSTHCLICGFVQPLPDRPASSPGQS
jgi:ubiquinone/menaquinone biosynthesis C-methylase UbiE